MSNHIDVLIFAPLDTEIDALRAAWGATSKPECERWGSSYYDLRDSNDGHFTVRVVKLRDMGVLTAGVVAVPLILEWQPGCVISFGIAGLLETGDDAPALGDVVIPSSVYYYEPVKESFDPETRIDTRTYRGEGKSTDFTLIPRIAYQSLGQYAVKKCSIGSGEKLVSSINAQTRSHIQAINERIPGDRKIQAVEMEASGILEAVFECKSRGVDPLFWVVKGLSDDATYEGKAEYDPVSKAKQRELRSTAAKHAANQLKRLVDACPAARFKKTRSALCEINDIYPHLDPIDLKARLERALGVLRRPFLNADLPKERLKFLLSTPQQPQLFYHWRLDPSGRLHWVDFLHLLLMKRMAGACNALPMPLITENRATTSAQKAELMRLIGMALGNGCEVSWHEDVKAKRGKLLTYASDHFNFSEDIETAIIAAPHSSGPGGAIPVRDWLLWMLYKGKGREPQIILSWYRHVSLYEQLGKLENVLPPLIAEGPDFILDGKLAKVDPPAKDLFIEPPDYPSIRACEASQANAHVMQDFVQLMSAATFGHTTECRLLPDLLHKWNKEIFDADG